jgi:ketosteroid isomerase-like protein
MTSTAVTEHPHVTTTREAFAAIERGDAGPFAALMPDDFVMVNHDNGAGDAHLIEGKNAFFGWYGTWMEFFGGTFAQDIVGVYGDDDRVLVIVHETGRRGDAEFDNQAIYLVEIRDGMWARLETYDRDREANARFWAAVGPMPAPAV